MIFTTPLGDLKFEIPDEWWLFVFDEPSVAMSLKGRPFYPYPWQEEDVEVVDIRSVEPPTRAPGQLNFKKYKLVPTLFAFTSPECSLPAIEVSPASGRYAYQVMNGFHRFYASVAVGYTGIPVRKHPSAA